MSDERCIHKWQVVTDIETVTVWADSEAQARSRAKWKAVHGRFSFRSRPEELAAVRDCHVYELKQLF